MRWKKPDGKFHERSRKSVQLIPMKHCIENRVHFSNDIVNLAEGRYAGVFCLLLFSCTKSEDDLRKDLIDMSLVVRNTSYKNHTRQSCGKL